MNRKIPYVSIFGNHDDEKSMSRSSQMAILESLPYSLARAGPSEIAGVGNYYVEVLARGSSDHSALTVYLLDSHAYSPKERQYPGYDWIKPDQIEWFRNTATSLKSKHHEYTHRHMDIAFIHIPLPEYNDKSLARLGAWREGVTAPKLNTNFRDALLDHGVVMVSAGQYVAEPNMRNLLICADCSLATTAMTIARCPPKMRLKMTRLPSGCATQVEPVLEDTLAMAASIDVFEYSMSTRMTHASQPGNDSSTATSKVRSTSKSLSRVAKLCRYGTSSLDILDT